MVNAQEWLNSKFPTAESKGAIQALSLSGDSSVINSIQTYTLTEAEKHVHLSLEGELDLSEFINLKLLYVYVLPLTKIRITSKIRQISLSNCVQLKLIEGLEQAIELSYLRVQNCPRLQAITFLEAWKQEIENLKAQLAEYENQETSSQASGESSYSDLAAKIAQKRQELQQALTSGRRSTAILRKVIELLERIQRAENKVKELEDKETNYLQQIRAKEQDIQGKQQQISQLQGKLSGKTREASQAQTRITQLEQQINNLNAEKSAIEERMLAERQEALRGFEEEKTSLQASIKTLNEQKDTFQKSADYLRETLKSTEKSLEEVKAELEQAQSDKQTIIEEKDKLLTDKSEELSQRNEAFKVVQERNTDLASKLSSASGEIDQLGQWISKLESASVEGDAFTTLKKELEQAQSQVASLQEQLSSKKGKSYW